MTVEEAKKIKESADKVYEIPHDDDLDSFGKIFKKLAISGMNRDGYYTATVGENKVLIFRMHDKDEDCIIDPETGCCVFCGVWHAEPCLVCGGRGFHKRSCPALMGME